ncbi:peptide synthetase [Streptomyces tateyamensis]|uniref:Peptide synthetase n=1 Tax=Streptomyces tateyamensis TaxID=565073 RepID=A0A2V4NMM1_9ACTN|nr:fatty acyl-AMP ligase [Streptomyces tateyamensis]PYC87369.1 peptide synthetase [Streptomyces tateyamensis]
MRDLIEATAHHAGRTPQAAAVVFATGDTERVLTYRQLVAGAQAVAAELRRTAEPGDRALLLFPTGLEFVTAFLGCLYARVVPVPVPLPDRGSSQRRRTSGVVADCGARLLLTDRATLPEVAEFAEQEQLTEVRCLAVEEVAEVAEADWVWPAADPQDPAFLQYTSGSTSDPKGVVVSHANLRHNFGELRAILTLEQQHTVCSWAPLFHDMGLIAALLLPLYQGGRTVLLPPTDFIRRPYTWLRLIQRHRATHSFAPNFAYNLCALSVTDQQLAELDLSSWQVAANGAEPVHARTLARFAERFAAAGFSATALRPAYGLAEATLGVTAGIPGRAPNVTTVDPAELEGNVFRPAPTGLELVSCGRPASLDLRIVDPADHRVLPDGQVGEIWLRGDSVSAGYWNKPEVNARVFGAATADGSTGYLRTGDLGVVHDGELYVTGRIKDMMTINGRNIYPHDVEREVGELHRSFGGLQGSVFSVPAPAPLEELVVVQEVRAARLDGTALPELAQAVKVELRRSLGMAVGNVVFLKPGRVSRTTSGKIQRSRMRELFVNGALEPLYEELSPRARARYRRPEPVGEGA